MSAKTRKSGTEVSIYIPREMLREIDRRKGQYFSRSKFVYWALNEFLKGNDIADGISDIVEKIPRGAKVGYQAPSGIGSQSDRLHLSPSSSEV